MHITGRNIGGDIDFSVFRSMIDAPVVWINVILSIYDFGALTVFWGGSDC